MDDGGSNDRYRRVIESAPYAYAYHRLITDGQGTPVDYEFVEVNPAFESMVGIPSERLLGRRVTEVLPGIRDGEFDWIACFGEVTLLQQTRTFEQYSAPLDRWYHVQAHSPQPGYFATIFFDVTGQRETREELSRATALLTDSHTIANMGAWELDFESDELYWTDGVYRLHELPPETRITPQTALSYYEDEYKELVKDSVRDLRANGTAFDITCAIRTATGRTRWIRTSGRRLTAETGGYRFVGIAQDITEQEEQRQLVTKRKEFLYELIHRLPDGFILFDRDGRHLEVNQRFTELLGYPREELEGTAPPFPYWSDRNRAEILSAFSHARATGGGSFELDFRHKDGHIVPVQVNVGALSDGDGRPVNYFATVRDISFQRSFEKRLQYRLELQRTIAQISSEFVSASKETIAPRITGMLEATGKCLDVDRAYVFEFSADRRSMSNTHEWCADGIASFRDSLQNIPVDTMPWWAERILSGINIQVARPSDLPPEAESFRAELEREGVHSLLQLPLVSGPTINGFLGFDVTRGVRTFSEEELTLLQLLANTLADALQKTAAEAEMINAREHAEAANRAKSDFLARMSHEIRTPMNAVIGFTDLLLNTRMSPLQKEYLHHVHTSARSLLGVIDDILDFSKIEAGKLELENTLVDLPQLIESAGDIVVYRAYEKGLELILDLDPDLPHLVHTDLTRLHQVLTNLLTNAVKFTEQGEVELSAWADSVEDPGRVSFVVRDTGPGISRNDYNRIFESFTQADQTITRRYGGTGLGLPISRHLVERMGGTLTVESKPGVGSSFAFTLRFEVETTQAPADTTYSTLSRVFVAEEHRRFRDVTSRLLCRIGIECTSVATGEQLLSLLERENPKVDAVFVDYSLPDIDGIELCSRIRRSPDPAVRDLPLVLMHSPTEGTELQQACDYLNIRCQLVKPIRPTSLYELVESLSDPERHTRYDDRNCESADAPTREATSYTAVTILVAEDNRPNALLAREMLQAMLPNSRIILAENGQEAIDELRRQRPDLVLMDIQMPELDGLDATLVIRREEQALGIEPRVPILALTAGVTHQERSRAIETGMDGEIIKPITIEHTREVLSRWLPSDAFAEKPSISGYRSDTTETRERTHSSDSSGKHGELEKAMNAEETTNIEYGSREEFIEALSKRGYRDEMIDELIALLRSRIPELINGLTQTLSAETAGSKLDNIARDAHAAKGILNSIEMAKTGNTALEVERAARAGVTKTAKQAANALIRKLKQLEKLL
ncbi:MAG: response regulator [Spirochaetales bacterium]